MTGGYTYQEIMSQPEAWLEALEVLRLSAEDIASINIDDVDEVMFTGCGSTYYLSVAAASLLQSTTAAVAKGLPASEIWLYPKSSYDRNKNTLLIAVSRSGTTTETLRAVQSFKQQATGKVITLSCYPESDLAKLGDINLVFSSGQEQSIAQTRAFSVLYLATVALARQWAGQDLASLVALAAAGRSLLERYGTLAKQVGIDADVERFYFLGSGDRYGLACELSLKMKEMTLSHSEPFHFLEFRHGPQAMVNDDTLIIGLLSAENKELERAVLEEMKQRGAKTLVLANDDSDVNFECALDASVRNVLYLPVVQLLAYERALSKGLDPDKPHNLNAVVVLDA